MKSKEILVNDTLAVCCCHQKMKENMETEETISSVKFEANLFFNSS